jgi:mono/diheme cytochrome c family protein
MMSEISTRVGKGAVCAVVVLATTGLAAPSLRAQEVTFARDVAPIFFESCAECHRPNSFAPMSLLDYQTARRYAARIKDRVEQRLMPPWHVDQTVGVQEFENEMSLTDDEIATIVAWVDAGAPEGNRSELPQLPVLPAGDAWELEEMYGRPPDLIVRSTPYDVIANGQDQWWGPEVPFEGLDQDRWIEAYEFKPAFPLGLNVVHHGHATLRSPEGAVAFAHYGVGKRWETFPEGVGMRWPAGEGRVEWNLHYFPVGEAVPQDVVEVGVWFYAEGDEPELETRGEVLLRVDRMGGMPRGGDILIPPGGQQVLQGVHVIDEPTLVSSFRPHMHMRGKEMSMEAIYPDGRREVLSKVGNYKHNWQISYQFAPDAKPLLPKGSVLLFTSVFDNSAANPLNPDPEQWVVFGRRGVDEMSHAWVGITELEQEDFDRMVAERQQRLISQEDDDQ